jgi:hypothetical protein
LVDLTVGCRRLFTFGSLGLWNVAFAERTARNQITGYFLGGQAVWDFWAGVEHARSYTTATMFVAFLHAHTHERNRQVAVFHVAQFSAELLECHLEDISNLDGTVIVRVRKSNDN